MTPSVRSRLRVDRGATAVEYAIMAGFIAAVIVVSVTAIGQSLIPWFQAAAAAL